MSIWDLIVERDENEPKPTAGRDYIDSHEENKNLLMALKKASDLGGEFEIPLADGSMMTVPADVATGMVEVLMALKPLDREEFLLEMGANAATFMAGLRQLLVARRGMS